MALSAEFSPEDPALMNVLRRRMPLSTPSLRSDPSAGMSLNV